MSAVVYNNQYMKKLLIGAIIIGAFLGTYLVTVANFSAGTESKGLALDMSLDKADIGTSTDSILDLTPNANNGVAVGTTWTTDRHGQADKAMSFNGTSDYVDLSSSDFITDFSGDTKGSISVWIDTASIGSDRSIFSITKGSTSNNLLYFRDNTDYKFNFILSSGVNLINILSNDSILNTGWVNVVVTQDGTTSKMYINGVLQSATDSGEWLADLSDLAYAHIGMRRRDGANGEFWNTKIDDIEYYSGKALSQDEITTFYDEYNAKISADTLAKGLVLDMSLDKADIGTSTDSILDLTPNANNGVAVGTTWTTDRHGQANKAMSFNGTSDYVDLGASVDDTMSGKTVGASMWVYTDPADWNGGVEVLLDNSITAPSTNNGFYVALDDRGGGQPTEGLIVTIARGGGFVSADTNNNVITSAGWYHIAFFDDGTNYKIYVNGVDQTLTNYASGTYDANALDLYIGAVNNGSLFFTGKMDDVKLWSRSMTTAEVTTLYDTYHGSFSAGSLSKGLAGSWSLAQEDIGTSTDSIFDLTPSANNGVAVGTTWTTDRKGQSNKAMSFNGTSDYVTLDNALNNSTFSISIWLKTSATGGTKTIIDGRDAADDGFLLWQTGSDDVRLRYNATEVNSSGNTINDGNWHNVVVTALTGSVSKIYIDGVDVSTGGDISGEGSISVTTAGRIGARAFTSATNFWNGDIGVNKYWNRALSQAEVTNLYNQYK